MRAFYRGYSSRSGRRAQQVRRLHLLRDEGGTFPGRQGYCNAPGWNVTNSPTVIVAPAPRTPPAGLSWCCRCLTRATELGHLPDDLAGLLTIA